MDYYVYRADVYCESCGEAIRNKLDKEGKNPKDPSDEYTYDSDEYPKGPYPEEQGESDTPQYCANCHEFLEHPLTSDGYNYVEESILRHIQGDRGNVEVLKTWVKFYGITLDDVFKALERTK